MNELDISGSMGKGGGGKAHTPVESNDTLRSRQTVKILLAVGEGEIDSIENVYLNRVAISNYNASYVVRTGLPGQSTISGFVDTEAPLSPFTSEEITAAEGYKTYSIEGSADAVRLVFFVPELKQYLENGDLVGSFCNLTIQTSPDGITNWTTVRNTTKSGKASSKYAWDVQVERPANPGVNWGVRVLRTTADSTSVKISNKTWISSIVKLYYKNLTYPNTAIVAITLTDAEQFGGQVPEVNIKGKFRKVRIPDNYNPTTRVYTGNWTSLQFNPVKQFTSNIAWVIYDVLHDSACLNIGEQDIDKASFYMLSQYADQMVDDGNGGTIPRYHIGYQYYSRENVPSFLANLLSICNAQLSNNAVGQISIMFDQPNAVPTKLITNANVIDGIFNYSSNDLEGRTTQVNVTFNNFDQFGETDTATWPMAIANGSMEETLLNRYGLQVSDIVLPGCRYMAQALRKARWAYYTNCKNTRFISFKTMLQGLAFYVGETIAVMDSENRQTMQHGVVVDATVVGGTVVVTLDRDITLISDSYIIQLTAEDGKTLFEKNIFETASTVNQVSYTGTELPYIGSVFILNNTSIEAKLYKVTGVQKEDNYYVIAGIEHDEAKYSYIDQGITIDLPTGDFVNMTDFTVEPIVNLEVIPVSSSTGTLSNIQLNVKWDWDVDLSSKFRADFVASWRRDGQDFTFVKDIQGNSFDINNAVPGTYDINVWAINPATGLKSNVVNYVYAYRTIAGASTLLPPVNASCSKSTTTLSFNTPALTLYFYYNTGNDNVVEDSLLDYVVELWDTSGVTKYGSYIVTPDSNKNGIFNLPFAENVATFGSAARQFQIKLYSRDLVGDVSTAYSVTVSNAVPAAPTFTLIAGTGSAYVNITPPADTDVAGYIIYQRAHSVTPWTPIPAEIVYDGPDTYVALGITTAGNYDFIVAAYDTFGKTGLNLASQQNVATLTAEVDKFAFTGLTFTPNSPTTNSVAWTSGTVSVNGAAPVAISSGSSAWTTGTLYLYFDKNTTSIGSTTDITVAVTKSQILAAYNGGTDLKGGDGTAFINGGQVLAQSIGANQLVTNNAIITGTAQIADAIITNTHIQNAAITNAKIGNTIESNGFSSVRKEGWRLSKDGVIESYGKIKLGTPNVGLGTPTLTFVPGALELAGNAVLNNSIIQKTAATTAWDTQGYSTQSYTGECSVFFSFKQVNGEVVAGLSVTPASSANNTSINYGIYAKSTGNIAAIESGTATANLTTYTVDDIFEVKYSGTTINYLKNGVSFKTTTVSSGQTLSFDSSIYTQNAVIDQIRFGQYLTVTPDYGARMEITGEVIKVYDRNNVLRVQLGNLEV